jgi:hypothetical protein
LRIDGVSHDQQALRRTIQRVNEGIDRAYRLDFFGRVWLAELMADVGTVANALDESLAISPGVQSDEKDPVGPVVEAAREFVAEGHRDNCRVSYRHCTCGADDLIAALSACGIEVVASQDLPTVPERKALD